MRVLFVCLGNICRSPTAHGVFESLLEAKGLGERFEVDSAGTAAWHEGKAPDERSQRAAEQRGYVLSHLRARQVSQRDFDYYDHILAMDQANLETLQARAPACCKAKLALFLPYAGGDELEVPDPYYGGTDGFEHVLDLVEQAGQGFLKQMLSESET